MKHLRYFLEQLKQYHPKVDEFGNKFELEQPHIPTDVSNIFDSTKHATIIPDQTNLPKQLNKIAFSSYKHKGSWNKVEGQGTFEEPPIPVSDKPLATGVIIHEKDGRIWTLSPSNKFGGYTNIIGPKGKLETGLNPRANAIKEAHEETGLKVHLVGHAHDVERSTSMTRYYHGIRVGGTPSDMGWETQAVHLVPREHLEHHLDSDYDKEVAKYSL